MGRPYQILLPLFSLFLVRVDLTDLFPMKIPVKVLKIYDGDTVLVGFRKGTIKVRLAKMDAPEMGQPFLNGRGDAGRVSRTCLLKLIKPGDHVVLVPEKSDIYGRVLGDLSEISLKAVRFGCTGLYPHATFRSEKEKYIYLTSLRKAQDLRKGIWDYSGFRQPKLWRKLRKRSAHRRSHR